MFMMVNLKPNVLLVISFAQSKLEMGKIYIMLQIHEQKIRTKGRDGGRQRLSGICVREQVFI